MMSTWCLKHVEAWNETYCETKIINIKLVNYWDKYLQSIFTVISTFGMWIARRVTEGTAVRKFLSHSLLFLVFLSYLCVPPCLYFQLQVVWLPNCLFLQNKVILKLKFCHCGIRTVFSRVIRHCHTSLSHSWRYECVKVHGLLIITQLINLGWFINTITVSTGPASGSRPETHDWILYPTCLLQVKIRLNFV